jgi:hypothetical protein
MTETKLYDADFYRGEIARIKLLLTQSITEQERERLQNNLRVAGRYLAEATQATSKPTKFDMVYVVIPEAEPGKRIGMVQYNESGYYSTDIDEQVSTLTQVYEKAAWLNGRLQVPAEVVESMFAASIFGWQTPFAERAHAYFKQ